MKNVFKVAFLSSVITAAMVYVILEWRPLRSESGPLPEVSWAASKTAGVPEVAAAAPAVPMGDDERNNIDIYKKYSPGVVNITAKTVSYNFFLGAIPESGTGSGAIIDAEGHIITNYHVIEGATGRNGSLEVTLADKSKNVARIVGADPNNDLAVLKIDVAPNRLSPIPLGTSKVLQVGQKVLAIGNPFGFERTLTTGIISSLGRSIEAQNGRIIEDIIQTDAAINPGNSGGPLLNSSGEIIGINTAIITPSAGSVGIGFAIPADTVQRIARDLISYGYVRRPYLGIPQSTIALANYPWLARGLGIEAEGLMLLEVPSSTPAARAGLRGATKRVIIRNYDVPAGGDVILRIDGRPVNTLGELGTAIDRHKPGERATVTVRRGDQQIDIPVVLEEFPR